MEKYETVKELGSGSFGKVYLVRSKVGGQLFAVKKIAFISEEDRETALNEVTINFKLDHPNIVKCVESFIEGQELCIVMEYADGGSLAEMIHNRGSNLINEGEVIFLFKQILLGVQYLHEKKVIHRDLKTTNVFLMKYGEIKIGDFGLSKAFESSHSLFSSQVGTPLYYSPEIYNGEKYSIKSDIWSLGCILYELCSLRRPFEATNPAALMNKIICTEPAPISNAYSQNLRSLISKMLSKNPEQRPSVQYILEYSFLQASSVINSSILNDRGNASNSSEVKAESTCNPSDIYIDRNLVIVDRSVVGFKGEGTQLRIEIPEGILEIANSAFKHSDFKFIRLPNSLKIIGENAFQDCSSFSSITIPPNVTLISDKAFSDCTSLLSVTIPLSVTKIGNCAFSNCSSLSSVTILQGVTKISDYAFIECSSLSSITIPPSVTKIGDYAFKECSSLLSITIPPSVTKIGDYAFVECSSLKSVVIAQGVTIIGHYAFCECSALSSVTFPQSLTKIGDFAFCSCPSLKSVTIPTSISKIGVFAFDDHTIVIRQ